MYKISNRGKLIKNSAVAIVNGIITLVILLIAPLGLAAVIANTLIITFSTFFVSSIFDIITIWLLNSPPNQYFDQPLSDRFTDNNYLQRRRNREIERRQDWE